MNAKTPLHPPMSAARAALLAVVILSSCLAARAQRTLHTWTGPDAGAWTVGGNWDTGVVPDGETADVLIDGSAGQNTTVTYTTAVASRTNGYVTVEAGDSLRLGKSYAGSATFHVMGVTNRGFLRLGASATANGQATTIISYGSNTVFNAAGANIEIQGTTTGRNRVYGNVRVPFDNTNNGTILVQQPYADRNGVQFQLADVGTFVNNGLIHLRVYGGSGTYGDYFARVSLLSPDSAPVSSILGTGHIWLDMEDLQLRKEGAAAINATSTSHIMTNGPLHTIEGGGTIALSVVNLGLVRAAGTNGYLSIQNSPIDVYNGKAIINEASGRLVAAGPCGMYVGTTGSAPSQFLNYGLVEARTGSFISFRKLTTTSASKSTPATTMILEGTVAGGGQFINNFRPIQLASTATLSPGDLSNDDGTGFSTTGQITFVTNLILNATTALDFQLGRAETAGVNYDSVAVVGSLTLDGVLNLSTLPGFGNGGTYTIFTCAPGGLTDNGLVLGSLPDGFGEPQLDVDAVAGTVSLFFPPRRTVLIIR